jgi:hypothetical protein
LSIGIPHAYTANRLQSQWPSTRMLGATKGLGCGLAEGGWEGKLGHAERGPNAHGAINTHTPQVKYSVYDVKQTPTRQAVNTHRMYSERAQNTQRTRTKHTVHTPKTFGNHGKKKYYTASQFSAKYKGAQGPRQNAHVTYMKNANPPKISVCGPRPSRAVLANSNHVVAHIPGIACCQIK